MTRPNSDYLDALASGEDPQDAANDLYRGIRLRRDDPHRDERRLDALFVHEQRSPQPQMITASATDAAEALKRALWLHQHGAPMDWVILTAEEVATVKAELAQEKIRTQSAAAGIEQENGRLRAELAEIKGCLNWGAINAGSATVLSEVRRTIMVMKQAQGDLIQERIKTDMANDQLAVTRKALEEANAYIRLQSSQFQDEWKKVAEARDALQSKLDALPADWQQDSSLKTWFPLTFETLNELRARNQSLTSDFDAERGKRLTDRNVHDEEADMLRDQRDTARKAADEIAEKVTGLALDINALRSVLEKCGEALQTAAQLPIARAYPDGPCMDKCDHDEVAEALTLATQTLAEHPPQPK